MNFIKLSNKGRTNRINTFSFIALLIFTIAIISSCFFIKIDKNESDSNPLSVQIEHAEGSKLNFTITNDGSKDLEFSSFDLPIRGHFKQYFKITDENGLEVPYIGKYALLVQTRDMWRPIKSGESIDYSVELFGEYDFSSTPGKYTIEFISPVTVMDINRTGTRDKEFMPSSLGQVQDVKSNEIESNIDITNSVDLDPETRSGCSSTNLNFISSAFNKAKSMLNNSLNYLTAYRTDSRWQALFGPANGSRYSFTESGVTKIKNAFNVGWDFNCPAQDNGAIAWVYKGSPYQVWLTSHFFGNSDQKFNGSVLAHEASHWNDIIGTNDFAYYNNCAPLANNNPDNAIRNADSYRQYIFNTSFYTGSGGGGDSGTSGINSGYYRISFKHSGKFLDVSGVSQSYGARIHQWAWWGGDNQKWYLQSLGNGYYKITAKHSGLCLDVSGGSQAPGAYLHQWGCHGGANQIFQIVDTGGGYYNIKPKHSGQCLDVYYGLHDNGANILQWPCHGGDNQKVRIEAQ